MKLIALRDLSYDGQRVPAGKVFDAVSRYAKVLKAVGRARDYVEPPSEAGADASALEPEPEGEPASPQPEQDVVVKEEEPMADASLTPVEPMTTKDNGALVPTRRGLYRRRDIEPGQTAVMAAEPSAAPDDDTVA